MKAISILILLCSVYSFSFSQQLSAQRSPKEIKPVIGEMVTISNANNLEERTHKIVQYVTPDGGNGTFLKYESPEQNTSGTTKQALSALHIVPNPGNGHFTLSVSNAIIAPGQLFIYDMLGVIIMRATFNNPQSIVINLADYPSGVYFIRCILGNKVLNQRMVKQ